MTDKEADTVSVAAEVTESGARLSVKSRFFSAWDHFFGAKADRKRATIDAEIAEIKAESAAKIRLFEYSTERAIQRAQEDPRFDEKLTDAFLNTLTRRGANKARIVELTVQELERDFDTGGQVVEGPDRLSEDFLNRFERYAEDATQEQIQERWAKVLASEIRKPGTFSTKVLRVVDELDYQTAQLFDRICAFRMDDCIPKCFSGVLNFSEITPLVDAGLLVNPGLTGQIRVAISNATGSGEGIWTWTFEDRLISIAKKHFKPGELQETKVIEPGPEGGPAIPVYVLTSAGRAIASLISNDLNDIIFKLATKISEAVPKSYVILHVLQGKTYVAYSYIQPKTKAEKGKIKYSFD